MTKPRVLILRAPGTNCDQETAFAFEQVGAITNCVHINCLIENPTLGRGYQILCLPGGFSYGDDIAAGRILAQRLSVHLSDLLESFRGEDRLALGICNGFQVMMRLGIFFPNDAAPPASLAHNAQNRFEDRWVHLVTRNSNSVFLRGIERMFLPIAHAEGRFLARDETVAERLIATGQLGLRYASGEGLSTETSLPFPDNPNGTQYNVAGISDPSGRIFGLMPHPERFIDPTQHPFWTRLKELPQFGDGRQIFQNAVDFFA